MEAARKKPTPNRKLVAACRLVTETYYGERGKWLLEAFDDINAKYFKRKLPTPLITLEITPHSGCTGWCAAGPETPPKITIHPSVFGGSGKTDPWGVKPQWLGEAFAYDTLIHECIHLSVQHLLGGYRGPSSHNNDAWVAEVNRIAPLMGFEGVIVGRQVSRRVVAEGGGTTKTGRPVTQVKKVDLGNVPFAVAGGFPAALRVYRGEAERRYVQANSANKLPTTKPQPP